MRPATSREPVPYLAAPAFSNCTVPIVVYPIFASNFVHVFHGEEGGCCGARVQHSVAPVLALPVARRPAAHPHAAACLPQTWPPTCTPCCAAPPGAATPSW